MSELDDLSNLADPEPVYKEKQSLLSKYDILIKHFEFDYIENCKDGKELEKIYHVLISGEEGHYPDLIKIAEEQLHKHKPKSRWLRKACPVVSKDELNKEELDELSKDLENWVSNISKHNKELEKRKVNEFKSDTDIRTPQTVIDLPKKVSEKRISSTDYAAWDKYDPDAELLKTEIAEEKEKKAILGEKKQKPKKKVTFNNFATEAEAAFISDREREKGNEFYKAGDYEDALHCYTNSILSKPCVNNLNNRAATYLKLKKYQLALEDCDKVLTFEGDNLKAHMRKAEALEELERFEEALECAEFVIQKDPNNGGAQQLAERVRRHCETDLKNTRMKIVEIE